MERRSSELYGLLAEFGGAERLVDAARAAYDSGYTDTQAYSPFPIEELSRYVKVRRRSWVPAIVLIGGRPLFSWPAFIPITFELTVLGAALFGAFGMLVLNGLPRLYHPVFTVPGFRLASNSRFFLCIKSTDEKFDRHRTTKFIEGLEPAAIAEVFSDRSTL